MSGPADDLLNPLRRLDPRLLGAGLALLVLLVLAYQPVLLWSAARWTGYRGFYGHGWLVLAMAGWLLWKDAAGFLRRPGAAHGRIGGLLLIAAVAATSLMGLAAWAAELLVVRLLAFWATLLLAWWAILGPGAWRVLAAPFCLLLLALPVWAPLQPLLQAAATLAVETALRLIGISAFVDGYYITIPNGTFRIEGGCSGLGFVLVSLSLAGYLAADARVSVVRGGVVLALALALAILANWLRILLIVLVGHYQGMDHPLVSGHVAFGWGVYALLFLPFAFMLARRLPRRPAGPAAPADSAGAGPQSGRIRGPLPLVLLALAASAAPGYARWLETHPPAARATPGLEAAAVSGYTLTADSGSTWRPQFPGATSTLQVRYQGGEGHPLWLFLADYPRQGPDAEVVNRMNDLAGPGWREQSRQADRLARARVVRHVLVDPDQRRLLVYAWYRVGGRHAGNATAAKLWQAVARIRGRTDARLTAIATPCGGSDCAQAARHLQTFARAGGLPR